MDGPANLVSSARRRLEDADKQYAFLANYTLNLLACKSGETYVSPKNGKYEFDSVIYRLCPSNGECNSDAGNEGCDSGYGDFVVGINTFLRQYLQAKEEEFHNRRLEDIQDDDKNNTSNAFIAGFSECRAYETDDDDETNQYFIGPACSDDGLDIKLELFTDKDCYIVADEGTFEDIFNGAALLFSSGGLVPNYCKSCVKFNDDGEAEVPLFCRVLYEQSGKCETQMEYFHDSGRQEGSCEFIYSRLPKSTVMNIVSPSSLYIEGGYDHRVAQFGPRLPPLIELNRSAAVEYNLVYAGEDSNYSSFCDPDDKLTADPPPQPFILMIDRAKCSFLSQVRHGQNVGAAAVLIADLICHCYDRVCKEQCDQFIGICQSVTPLLADDGSGSSDIVIPSYLLNKYEADQIKNFLNENSEKSVKLEISGNPLPSRHNTNTAAPTHPEPSLPLTTESASESSSASRKYSPSTASSLVLVWVKLSMRLSLVILAMLQPEL